jgi:fumarate hydratase class II
MAFRRESDSMGSIEVPADRYWGAQTQRSLVTALNPVIGYDRAAQVAKLAYQQNLALKEAAVQLGFMSAEDFDRYVRPEQMVSP